MERIGKYEILEQIGAGGFGVVFKGRDPLIERLVAVKTCNSDDEELRHRFVREARTAGRLQHRNITTVYDFGYHEGLPYLVQEYLTGEDLDRVLKRGDNPPLPTRLSWLEQVARGLGYAHANGIVHRDVKPANIRILEDGTAKIMDFGIAKLLENDSGLTRAGATVGTAAYLAPEQLHGEPVDARTDLFAFGVVAYELLAGRRPFAGKQLSAVIYQILHHEPEPVASLNPRCPPDVADLVARCLAKDRVHRPRNADEVADELAAILAGLGDATAGLGARRPILAPPPPVAPSRPPAILTTAAMPQAKSTAPPPPPPPSPPRSLPPRPSVETTSGIRELDLDGDASNDHASLSGTQAFRTRGVPWGPVLAGSALLAIAVAGVLVGPKLLGRARDAVTATTTPAIVTEPLEVAGADPVRPATDTTSSPAPTEPTAPEPLVPVVAQVPPPQPTPATLVLTASWSPTATVSVAGRRLNLGSEQQLELPAGEHTLEFALTEPYRATSRTTVTLAAGDRRVISPPFRRPGLLTVQPHLGTPPGRITVDGEPLAQSVVRGKVLAPGTHTIRIEPANPGAGEAIDYEATLEPGQELVLTFDLASKRVIPVLRSVG